MGLRSSVWSFKLEEGAGRKVRTKGSCRRKSQRTLAGFGGGEGATAKECRKLLERVSPYDFQKGHRLADILM